MMKAAFFKITVIKKNTAPVVNNKYSLCTTQNYLLKSASEIQNQIFHPHTDSPVKLALDKYSSKNSSFPNPVLPKPHTLTISGNFHAINTRRIQDTLENPFPSEILVVLIYHRLNSSQMPMLYLCQTRMNDLLKLIIYNIWKFIYRQRTLYKSTMKSQINAAHSHSTPQNSQQHVLYTPDSTHEQGWEWSRFWRICYSDAGVCVA